MSKVNEAENVALIIKGVPATDSDFRIDKYGDTSYRVFFVVAPDGLCYCLGERQHVV